MWIALTLNNFTLLMKILVKLIHLYYNSDVVDIGRKEKKKKKSKTDFYAEEVVQNQP